MLKNYFKIAFRGLLKNKSFTLINILGLALGVTAFLLIVFYVVDELSYDRYNIKASRIYRVNEDLKLGDNKVQYAVCMAPLAQTLKSDYPEVENVVRFKRTSSHFKKGTETFLEYDVLFADASVFDVFTLPLIYGDAHHALAKPNTVVLTKTAAKKYFGRTNVVGESLLADNNVSLLITGVMNDMPATSHFKANFLVSMSSYPNSYSDEWLRSDYNTYVLFHDKSGSKKLEAQFSQLLKKYSGLQMQSELKMSYDAFEKGGSYFKLNLIPLTDIHLHSNMTGELGVNGTVQYVYFFSIIAIFILVVACLNFINLSTARSANRSREVGVRKVLGSARKQLVFQFLSESVLIVFIATLIALAAAALLLPVFNQLSGKSLAVTVGTLQWLVPAVLISIMVVGLLSGAYPAFFLSSFRPVDVLKGKLSGGFQSSKLRNALVTFQFFISVFLITGTLVVFKQLQYVQNRDLGYNRNQVLIIHNAFELGNQAKVLKQELRAMPGVVNATLTAFLPVASARNTAIFYKEAVADPKQSLFPQVWSVDEDYVSTLGMKIIAGRNFSNRMSMDSSGVILNQTAVKFLGLINPINKTIYRSSGGVNPTFKPYRILGVVKDFNFNSLRENISPVIMQLSENSGSLSIRINTANLPALLTNIQQKWKSLSSAQFEYAFMDAEFDKLYRTEQQVGKIFLTFTILAITIACLGLFGLAAYAAEQRTKEIGIRKVLGAEVSVIVALLSKDFIKLVVIAIVLATPLAWWAMHQWLQEFAYRINISWWVYALSGCTAIFIASITVSFQSVKAAMANPIKSLRSE
ncbi:ABC transporter permease [Mucilaginibacter lacusdianchii]|uniref:ABC transporter permease n=1 Tax=Mucilaginibacter lacusdianchii TaxID=2684211 RepID=UPI00131E326B|nr:ABC transporter permease [Mucilaginibacter sp. JXJ CY 39]